MTDQEHEPTNDDSSRSLDRLLDQRARAVLMALYTALHHPRHTDGTPVQVDVTTTVGLVFSMPSFDDHFVRFTISVYDTDARRTQRKSVRVASRLFADSCPDLDRGDFVEIIAKTVPQTPAREVIYLRRVGDGPTPLELFIEIIGGVLALQPHGDEAT
jgi:hypothetical protein